jgi:NAD(P)-dependent dehydrogenase (short-subunit alcohol dehydrogenase family)
VTNSLFNLSSKVAVVSGAASGMGRAMSLALAEAGADLVLVDINEEGTKLVADEVEAFGQRALVSKCDISNPKSIIEMFKDIDTSFGRIDFLGNVAGEAIREKPEKIRLEDIEYSWRNIVLGRFCCCQEAGRRMLKQGGGSIVNIGSLASITALGRGHIGYSMAMGAVAQMTRELSTEWAHRGVRVNAILPAQIMNNGLQERIHADPKIRDRFLSGIPSGRFGSPEDIRGLAVFLASDASSWITGTLIPMDGGNLAQNAGGSHGSEIFNE